MELYLNSSWTESYGNSYYVAEAIAWSENGNHATIYTTGSTADEADTKLLSAARTKAGARNGTEGRTSRLKELFAEDSELVEGKYQKGMPLSSLVCQ